MTTDDLFSYHSGVKRLNFTEKDATTDIEKKFSIGIEVEKSLCVPWSVSVQELYEDTGFIFERDGSISNGYEMITPTMSLFSPKTIERLEEMSNYINHPYTENCGGHIHFSEEGLNDFEVYDKYKGFFPLLFAMYKVRVLNNSYCKSSTPAKAKGKNDRYYAITLRGNRLEFRLFSAVSNLQQLIWRITLLQIMTKLYAGRPVSFVVESLLREGELSKHLRKVYTTNDRYYTLLADTLTMSRNYDFGTRIKKEKQLRDAIEKSLNETITEA